MQKYEVAAAAIIRHEQQNIKSFYDFMCMYEFILLHGVVLFAC